MMGTPASWTTNPLNMVNYYGFGRLAWDATLTPDQIYKEWILRTFGAQLPVAAQHTVHELLRLSEEPATQLGIYHGYRGVWYENGKASAGQEGLFESPTSVDQIINRRHVGTTRRLARQAFDAYSPGVQAIYSNYSDPRTEAVLLEWGLFEYNYTLTNGRTILEDMAKRPVDGLNTAQALLSSWKGDATSTAVKAAVGEVFHSTVASQLQAFVTLAQAQVKSLHGKLAKLHPKEMAQLRLKADDDGGSGGAVSHDPLGAAAVCSKRLQKIYTAGALPGRSTVATRTTATRLHTRARSV